MEEKPKRKESAPVQVHAKQLSVLQEARLFSYIGLEGGDRPSSHEQKLAKDMMIIGTTEWGRVRVKDRERERDRAT